MKTTKAKLNVGLFFIVFSAFTIFFFQNCSVEKPKVEDMSVLSVGFSHSPTPNECMTCHIDSRPLIGKTLSADGISNLFVHELENNGKADCVLCHTQNQNDVGKTWKNGVFNHKNNIGISVTSCRECHLGNMPMDTNHSTIGNKDCFECHKKSGVSWKQASFSHSPIPTSCTSCHNSSRPDPTKYFPSNPALPNINLYTHATVYNGSSDCVNCHTNVVANVGVKWSGGHFNHKTNTGAIVSSCLDCHTGSRPSSHTVASGKSGDCKSCHTSVGISWSVSTFSHVPTPVSCNSCHTNSRPSATVFYPANPAAPKLNLYAHSTQYNGQSDCVLCHVKVAANVGVKWAGGYFNHKSNTGANVATCIECHTGSRPATHTAASGKMGDCVSCHTNAGLNWLSTNFNHSPTPTSCNGCHNDKRPAATKFFPYDTSEPTLNLYAHTAAYNGTSDCVSCHTVAIANIGVKWAGGYYNHKTSAGVSIATCIDCHTGSRPSSHTVASGKAGECASCHKSPGVNWKNANFSHSPTPSACNTCHSTSRPATTKFYPYDSSKPTLNLYAHTSAYNGTSDCVNCHTKVTANIGVKWSGGYYNHKTAMGSTVATCIDCHVGSRPVSHTAASGMAGDCVACHTSAGVSWKGAAAVPASVTYLAPTTTSWASIKAAHPSTSSRSGMTCATCHVNYNATLSIKGFDHDSIPSNTKCVSCHVKGQQVVSGVSLQTVSASHGSSSYNKDCSSCHLSMSGFSYPKWDATNKKFTGGSW